MDLQDQLKHEVAAAAAQLVKPGMTLGLGSGSTAAIFIEQVGQRVKNGELDSVRGVPTSFQAEVLAVQHGVPFATLNEVDRIDLAVDGADEVAPNLDLTKGGGGCHTEEKLVDAWADRLIIVVDDSKLVSKLGEKMPIPVEVLPDTFRQVTERLERIGGKPELRMAVRKAGPVITDQGNFLIDTTFAPIDNPGELEKELNNMPGVLDVGLFVGLADKVLIGEVRDGKPYVREMTK